MQQARDPLLASGLGHGRPIAPTPVRARPRPPPAPAPTPRRLPTTTSVAAGRFGNLLRSVARDGAKARRELRADILRKTLLGDTISRLHLQWLDAEVAQLMEELAARHRALWRRTEVWAACQRRQAAAWQARVAAAEAAAATAFALAEDLKAKLAEADAARVTALERAARIRTDMLAAAAIRDRETKAANAAVVRMRRRVVWSCVTTSVLAALLAAALAFY